MPQKCGMVRHSLGHVFLFIALAIDVYTFQYFKELFLCGGCKEKVQRLQRYIFNANLDFKNALIKSEFRGIALSQLAHQLCYAPRNDASCVKCVFKVNNLWG